MGQYLRRNGPVILRAYGMYRPVQTFVYVALLLPPRAARRSSAGSSSSTRATPRTRAHAESLTLGVGRVVLAFLVAVVAMLSDLLAANRRLLEEMLARLRRLDAQLAARGAAPQRAPRRDPQHGGGAVEALAPGTSA